MTVDERREAVVQMRARGMSTRAIADELGISDYTVRADIEATARDHAVEQPDVITGRDGKKRKARKDPRDERVRCSAAADAAERLIPGHFREVLAASARPCHSAMTAFATASWAVLSSGV